MKTLHIIILAACFPLASMAISTNNEILVIDPTTRVQKNAYLVLSNTSNQFTCTTATIQRISMYGQYIDSTATNTWWQSSVTGLSFATQIAYISNKVDAAATTNGQQESQIAYVSNKVDAAATTNGQQELHITYVSNKVDYAANTNALHDTSIYNLSFTTATLTAWCEGLNLTNALVLTNIEVSIISSPTSTWYRTNWTGYLGIPAGTTNASGISANIITTNMSMGAGDQRAFNVAADVAIGNVTQTLAGIQLTNAVLFTNFVASMTTASTNTFHRTNLIGYIGVPTNAYAWHANITSTNMFGTAVDQRAFNVLVDVGFGILRTNIDARLPTATYVAYTNSEVVITDSPCAYLAQGVESNAYWTKNGLWWTNIPGSNVWANITATNYTAGDATLPGHLGGIAVQLGIDKTNILARLQTATYDAYTNSAVIITDSPIAYLWMNASSNPVWTLNGAWWTNLSGSNVWANITATNYTAGDATLPGHLGGIAVQLGIDKTNITARLPTTSFDSHTNIFWPSSSQAVHVGDKNAALGWQITSGYATGSFVSVAANNLLLDYTNVFSFGTKSAASGYGWYFNNLSGVSNGLWLGWTGGGLYNSNQFWFGTNGTLWVKGRVRLWDAAQTNEAITKAQLDSATNAIRNTLYVARLIQTNAAWDDLNYDAVESAKSGTDDIGPVDATDITLPFADSATTNYTDDHVMISGEIPHEWKTNTDLRPHAHFYQTNADQTNMWFLRYRFINSGAIATNDFLDIGYATNLLTYSAPTTYQYAAFASIPGAGKACGAAVQVRLYRDGTFGTGNAKLVQFGIHYQIDSLGSDSETSKGF